MTDYPTISLRGAAMPIMLAKLQIVANDTGVQYEFEADDAGNIAVETVGIVMDINVLAQFEEKFGSLEEWQKALTVKPFTTLRDSVAICIGRDATSTGKAMLPSETQTYMAAVGAAFAIANGVDPSKAQELMEKAKVMDVNAELDKLVANEKDESTDASPSTVGSAPGPSATTPTANSGD